VLFDGFDWDKGNRGKCLKHSVSVDEIENLFYENILVAPDIHHSSKEQRFRAIGITFEGRYLFIVFTMRLKNKLQLIRPISARYMHKKEVNAHEKEISRIQK